MFKEIDPSLCYALNELIDNFYPQEQEHYNRVSADTASFPTVVSEVMTKWNFLLLPK